MHHFPFSHLRLLLQRTDGRTNGLERSINLWDTSHSVSHSLPSHLTLLHPLDAAAQSGRRAAKYALLEHRIHRRGGGNADADICKHFLSTGGLSSDKWPFFFFFSPSLFLFPQPINTERGPEMESIEAIRPLRPTANKPSSTLLPSLPLARSLRV